MFKLRQADILFFLWKIRFLLSIKKIKLILFFRYNLMNCVKNDELIDRLKGN